MSLNQNIFKRLSKGLQHNINRHLLKCCRDGRWIGTQGKGNLIGKQSAYSDTFAYYKCLVNLGSGQRYGHLNRVLASVMGK